MDEMDDDEREERIRNSLIPPGPIEYILFFIFAIMAWINTMAEGPEPDVDQVVINTSKRKKQRKRKK